MFRQKRMAALLLSFIMGVSAVPAEAGRRVHSLAGDWQFQPEGAGAPWKTVTLPASFEEHEGVVFDGVGIYVKTIPRHVLLGGKRALPNKRRVILHFQAVATLAEVWFDGIRLGSHLGGWTPFRFDVSELVRYAHVDGISDLAFKLVEGSVPDITPGIHRVLPQRS